MNRPASTLVLASLLFALGPDPTARGQELHDSDWCEVTQTRPSAEGTGSVFSRSTTSAPGTRGVTSSQLLGVDITPDNLLDISTVTGNGTPIGVVGDDVIGGMAYDPGNQILYGSSSSNNVLVTIDPSNGATTTIGPFGVTLMHGLGYDSDNDVLYGITNQSSTGARALWIIDVTTGVATHVGNHMRAGLSGLAYDPLSETMYASDSNTRQLYTIDLGTGSVTLVGSFGVTGRLGVGLGFDVSLGLYGCDNKGTGAVDDELFRIDTATGAATLVGPILASNVLGLTFIPGDPLGTKYCAANSNSTGSSADISASGSASSSAGNLTLEASPVPNQPGIFFHGANQIQVTFGNGFLCAGGGLNRGSVVVSSSNLASYTYDNSTNSRDLSSHIGSNRNFQYWHRDPMGGGALFNTSNAISIDILP